MKIDLIRLVYNQVNSIEIDETVNFDDEKYKTKDIIKLLPVTVRGKIEKNSIDEIYLNVIVSGTMILKDSRSFKDINYDFNIEISNKIEENDKNNQNMLDITEILWENIVLEVPISISNEEDIFLKKGEGWELKSN